MIKEPFLYNCKYEYCDKKFEPKRRRVQKFCSSTCRSKHWFLNNPSNVLASTPIQNNQNVASVETNPEKNEKLEKKINKMREELKTNKPSTLADFLISTAGTFIGNKIDRATIKEEDKPLTNGNMMSILSNIQRFQKVNNLPLNEYGQQPFIDITTGNIEYIGGENSFLDY